MKLRALTVVSVIEEQITYRSCREDLCVGALSRLIPQMSKQSAIGAIGMRGRTRNRKRLSRTAHPHLELVTLGDEGIALLE